ncbi:MAG: hypothetical protein HYR84_09090 [Planctomycetes bacterium]|nr:hypothetical protein [Planctomycetota bacterium]
MSRESGKTVSITPFRSLVIDLLHFCAQVPGVTIDRRMSLAPLVAARQACSPRPMWTSLFIKGYSLVAASRPMLRQSYMTFPWARFYEHPSNIANVNIRRQVDGEDVVLQALIRRPENRSLLELDGILRNYMDAPVETLPCYRRARRMSMLPSPLRRFLMWATLNIFGRRRCHNFGTFTMSSVSGEGAGILTLMIAGNSMLHYGLIDDQGRLDVRLTFDHRVLDGAPAAEGLAALESTMLGAILDEVKSMANRSPVFAPKLAA